MDDKVRAEIFANGLVQGVGFRYFIQRSAEQLGLTGFTRNLYTGEVQTVVEGTRASIEALFMKIKTGPSHSSVKNATITWSNNKNEFSNFEIRH